jgi:site-specific DNA recombinase
LVHDETQVRIIKEVERRVLDGEPLRSVAHDLTARGVLTPRDRFAQAQGREAKGYGWHSAGLKRALTSQTLLGYAVGREALTDAQGRVRRDSKGKKMFGPEMAARNDDGSPVVRATPILTREEFDRLGAELAERENRREPTRRSTGLLLKVIFCGVCGRPAYRLKGGVGRSPRYRCASAQYKEACGNKSIPMDYADDAVERILLGMLGESERLERVWYSGSDHSAELATIDAELVDLTSQLGRSAFRAGTPQRAALDARIDSLTARQDELSAEVVKPAGWSWEPTGEKFSDWWTQQDTEARNIWLRSMNITLGFTYSLEGRGPSIHLDLGDIEQLTAQMDARGPVVGWQAVFAAMGERGIAGIEMRGDGDVRFVPA